MKNVGGAVFLDRDGVINEAVDRGERWTAPFCYGEFKIKSGIVDALKQLGDLGFPRIIFTNQPDIKYGLLPQEEHDAIMREMAKLPLEDIFICFHGREDNCDCKKPKPGMLYEAAKKWKIDLSRSFVVGDSKNDILAGKSAGCATILINAPYNYNEEIPADFRVSNLSDAVKVIKNKL